MREKESRIARVRPEAHALSSVVSEETLVSLRADIMAMPVKHGERDKVSGKAPLVPFEVAYWRARAQRALRGSAADMRAIDRLLYGWLEKQDDIEARIAVALGVSVAQAREAVSMMEKSRETDPHAAALGAAQVLVWYTRTQRPLERSVTDAIAQAYAQCSAAEVVVDQPSGGDALELQ